MLKRHQKRMRWKKRAKGEGKLVLDPLYQFYSFHPNVHRLAFPQFTHNHRFEHWKLPRVKVEFILWQMIMDASQSTPQPLCSFISISCTQIRVHWNSDYSVSGDTTTNNVSVQHCSTSFNNRQNLCFFILYLSIFKTNCSVLLQHFSLKLLIHFNQMFIPAQQCVFMLTYNNIKKFLQCIVFFLVSERFRALEGFFD